MGYLWTWGLLKGYIKNVTYCSLSKLLGFPVLCVYSIHNGLHGEKKKKNNYSKYFCKEPALNWHNFFINLDWIFSQMKAGSVICHLIRSTSISQEFMLSHYTFLPIFSLCVRLTLIWIPLTSLIGAVWLYTKISYV